MLLKIIKDDAALKLGNNFISNLETEHDLSAIDKDEQLTIGPQEATRFLFLNEDELEQLLGKSPL